MKIFNKQINKQEEYFWETRNGKLRNGIEDIITTRYLIFGLCIHKKVVKKLNRYVNEWSNFGDI